MRLTGSVENELSFFFCGEKRIKYMLRACQSRYNHIACVWYNCVISSSYLLESGHEIFDRVSTRLTCCGNGCSGHNWCCNWSCNWCWCTLNGIQLTTWLYWTSPHLNCNWSWCNDNDCCCNGWCWCGLWSVVDGQLWSRIWIDFERFDSPKDLLCSRLLNGNVARKVGVVFILQWNRLDCNCGSNYCCC